MDNKKVLGMLAILILLGILFSTAVVAGPLDTLRDGFSRLMSFGGSNLIVFVVNTLILALLFIGIALASGFKLESSQKILFSIAMAVVAVFISYNLMQTQPGVYVWKIRQIANFLHLKVIVNTAVMATAIFLISALFGITKKISELTGESKVAEIGFYLLSVVIALNYTMAPFADGQTWDNIKDDYHYIWEEESVKDLIRYAFGEADCRDDQGRSRCYEDKDGEIIGYGFLIPPYLFVFIGATLLFLWLFEVSLNIGGSIKQINYLIAILLGASVAHEGMTFNTFLTIAQWMALFIFYKQLSKGEGADKKWAFAQSFFIVGLLSWLVFPTSSILPFQISFSFLPFTSLVGKILGFGGLALILGFLFGLVKYRGKSEVMKDFGNWSLSWFVRVSKKIPIWKSLMDHYGPKEKTSKGNIPKVFRDMLEVSAALNNWALRLEVWIAKSGAIYANEKGAVDLSGKAYKKLTPEKSVAELMKKKFLYRHIKVQFDEKAAPKEGKTNVILPGGKDEASLNYYEPAEVSPIKELPEDASHSGALDNWLTVRAVFLGISKAVRNTSDLIKDVSEEKKEVIEKTLFGTDVMNEYKDISGKIEERTDAYFEFFDKMGVQSEIHTLREYILNTYMMHGAPREHTLKIAKPTATVYYYRWMLDHEGEIMLIDRDVAPFNPKKKKEKNKHKKLVKKLRGKYAKNPSKLRPYPAKENAGLVQKNLPHEVLRDSENAGWFTEDVNEITTAQALGYNPNEIINSIGREIGQNTKVVIPEFIRKVNPHDIVDFTRFEESTDWLETAWRTAIEDFRYGYFHPQSKTLNDYKKAYTDSVSEYSKLQSISPLFNYERVRKEFGRPSYKDPAFDMDALTNETDLKFWGGKDYFGDRGSMKTKFPLSPWPTLSASGLSRFFEWYAEEIESDPEKIRQMVESFVRDSGGWPEVLQRKYTGKKNE